ncbi:MAG TPA: glycosyl hydrolase, partial [Vicinamibacteria bacterium]|nr:glycosyl hydrolase [Vicinamibacteria bacterium]
MKKPFTPVFNALGVLIALALAAPSSARDAKPVKPAEKDKKDPLTADALAGLELRGIGPALTSGRIVDIAVDAAHPGTYYVAAASGGLWKTTSSGTTFTPVFDKEGSYSIGCVTVDPKHPLTVWVGTGENNSQRSVGYGDGVYRSLDGGKKWENLGLKASEHISKILIDPRDSQTVYLAAQGPLWAPGGDRGVFKTSDGGKNWKAVLKISENTGANDLLMDPRDPDVLYASTYQRRRHVWTLIDGGPESGIYKSTDAGANWKRLENGLPKTDMGRIGLAISPARPDVIYAIVEASDKAGGFHRSTDGGANWEKMSDHISSSPQYYNRIFADPKKVDRVYSVDVWIQVTEDGGKTFKKLGERAKHVDNHTLWINPDNPDYILAGCDGGLYETFDRGSTWSFKANLPITQFYRVALDNAQPFYGVYGGTQDNFTLGGPSRTATAHG